MLDQAFTVCLVLLAIWLLLSGLDDLVVTAGCCALHLRRRFTWPSEEQLQSAPAGHVAVLVPLWHEHGVVAGMLRHNLAAIRYPHFDFFVGVYPNDPQTERAAAAVARHSPRVHVCVCRDPGPTSKADCLNWIWDGLRRYERENGRHFDIVVTHDAEDLVHPEALRLINYFCREFDMVQIPVLPLATPLRRWTQGVYCDEFAEYQCKDIPVRRAWGGFLAGNGVGTGFRRSILEELANGEGRIFDPECLTEDYEMGLRVHALGGRQIFVPLDPERLVATREYFPATAAAAIRQRTRWVTGISLQCWQRHGWGIPGQRYWLWRDRKGLLGNLVSPAANLLCVLGTAGWVCGIPPHLPRAALLLVGTVALAVVQMLVRAGFVSAVYGVRMAWGVPLRAVWGNWVNGVATVLAIRDFVLARLEGRTLGWTKTTHVYPNRAELMPHKRRLGEILVSQRLLSPEDLAGALAGHNGNRLGEHLVDRGLVSRTDLYTALAFQQSLPFGAPPQRAIERHATRVFPAEVAHKWKAVPYRAAAGKLLVASAELPTAEMLGELRRHSGLELRFRLITPEQFAELEREFLL